MKSKSHLSESDIKWTDRTKTVELSGRPSALGQTFLPARRGFRSPMIPERDPPHGQMWRTERQSVQFMFLTSAR